MPTSLTESLQLLYREAMRAPWIGLTVWRGWSDDGETSAARAGEDVLVLGGFLSHPAYYAPIGRTLGRRGYVVHFDEAFNARPLLAHVAELRERVDRIVQASGAPLRVVGHSLGGIQAMVLLMEMPETIGQVIAVASPVVGGTPWRPLQRLVERVLQVRAEETEMLRRRLVPYAHRIVTISSPHDLVAPPATCAVEGAANLVLDDVARHDRLASHGGVIFARPALRAVVDALRAPLAATDDAVPFVPAAVAGSNPAQGQAILHAASADLA